MSTQTPGYFEEQDPGTVQIADIWHILWFRRYWLIASVILFGGAAIAYATLTPARFSAVAEILVDPRGRQVLSNDLNPNTMSPDGGLAQVESQSQVVTSTSVLLRAITSLHLTDDDEFGSRPSGLGAVVAMAKDYFGFARSQATPEAVTLQKLLNKLGVKRADKAFVIDVTVTSTDPVKAARIVNAIVDAYVAEQAASQTNAAISASSSLSAGLEDQRQKVREAADAVAAYKAANNLVEANNLLFTDQTLSERAAALSEAKARTAQQRARFERLGSGTASDSTQEAMQSATITDLRAQEAQLVQSQSQLRQDLGPRHPSLRKIDAQLADLRGLIDKELSRLRDSARRDLDRALAYENELSTSLDQLKTTKASADQASVGLAELQRELDARRTVYANYLQRSQETREQANIDSSNMRVISRALPPIEKSWPPTMLLVCAAAGLGLGLAATAALLREYLVPTILSRVQLQQSSHATDLGTVVVAKGIASMFNMRRIDPTVAQTVRKYANNGSSLLVISGPQEAVERRRLVRSMVVASAAEGLRVLLMDVDPERHAGTSRPGLADLIAGTTSLSEAVAWDERTGIAILGYGSGVVARSKGPRISEVDVLAELVRHFDFIILDGGPLTGSTHPDLLAAADNVIFAARIGKTRRADVASAMAALANLGRRISGTLLLGSKAA